MGEETIEGVTREAEQQEVWMEVGEAQEEQPEAVKVLYKKLKPAVTLACERGRERMRMGYAEYLRGLAQVRDALKPSKKFKQWCEAWGLNYGTVCNALSLAEKRAQRAKRAAIDAVTETETNENVSFAPPTNPTPEAKRKKAQLILTLDDETLAEVRSGLRKVLDELGDDECRGTNNWGQGVALAVEFYLKHRQQHYEAAGEHEQQEVAS